MLFLYTLLWLTELCSPSIHISTTELLRLVHTAGVLDHLMANDPSHVASSSPPLSKACEVASYIGLSRQTSGHCRTPILPCMTDPFEVKCYSGRTLSMPGLRYSIPLCRSRLRVTHRQILVYRFITKVRVCVCVCVCVRVPCMILT